MNCKKWKITMKYGRIYQSMKESIRLAFWVAAYNGKVFRSLHMQDTDNSIQVINCKGNELIYSEQLKNFQAGCSDDDVWAEVRSSFLK